MENVTVENYPLSSNTHLIFFSVKITFAVFKIIRYQTLANKKFIYTQTGSDPVGLFWKFCWLGGWPTSSNFYVNDIHAIQAIGTGWPKFATDCHILCFSKLHLKEEWFVTLKFNWVGPWEDVSYVICEQQRCRSACASAQSDQCLCCSLLRLSFVSSFCNQNFKAHASFCSWAGQFESDLVGNSRRHVFSWRGSIISICYSNKNDFVIQSL